MAIRTTRQYVDILGPGDGTIYITRQYVDVLGEAPAEAIEVSASDAIVISDEAVSHSVFSVSSTDVLSLSELLRRIYEVSTYSIINLSDQAQATRVRVVYDTLSISDEAIADIEVTRHVTDSLVLTCTAAFTIIRLCPAEDTLGLQDQADVSVIYRRKVYEALSLVDKAYRINSANDTLVLTDTAVADRVISSSDSLSLSDAATTYTIHTRIASNVLELSEVTHPGYTTQRDVTDTLSLVEEAIGDYCRVADDSLSLSDAATYDFVRLIHDELSLGESATFAGIFKRKSWDTLVLSDAAHTDREIDGVASDSISISEEASLLFEASDTLSLSDSATVDYCRIASDTLTLSDLASAVRDRQSSSDTLVFVELAAYTIIRNVKARDQADLDEYAWPGFQRVEATDALQTEYIDYDPDTYEEIITYTGLQDAASAALIPYASHDEDDRLYLSDRAECIKINADAIEATASDAITLTEESSRNRLSDASDLIALSEAADVVSSKLIIEDLDITETATFNIVRNNLVASDTISLNEAVLWYNQLEDYLYVYHPFVGEASGDLPDPPDEELEGPIPGITDTFKLVYPVVGPFDDTLVLRAPNLGNRDRLQMNRISRETRGGTLITFADPIWPKIQTLVLNFSGLSWTEVSGLHTFMDDHLGQEIGLLDWEHRFWSGVITKLDDPITQDGRDCQYSVGFEFEGELTTYSP